MGLLMHQCSPHAGKSVLRFFFDGVPEADSIVLTEKPAGTEPSDTGDQVTGFFASLEPEGLVHYPYGENECASCHDEHSPGNMLEPQPALCYTCHEDYSGSYRYLHGPVAGGYCTACHDPHRSANEHLLKLTGDELCFYCHQENSVKKNEMHQDLAGMQCTDCHNPHGGDDIYIFH